MIVVRVGYDPPGDICPPNLYQFHEYNNYKILKFRFNMLNCSIEIILL